MRAVARALVVGMLLAIAAILAACTPGASVIHYGHDDCAYCRMVISDPRYGAQLVTTTGKVYRFDSIECLASYYRQAHERGTVRSVWVSDYAHPGTFMAAEEARYQRAPGVASPMGKGIIAMAPSAGSGTALRWSDVLLLVARDTMSQGAGAEGAAARGIP